MRKRIHTSWNGDVLIPRDTAQALVDEISLAEEASTPSRACARTAGGDDPGIVRAAGRCHDELGFVAGVGCSKTLGAIVARRWPQIVRIIDLSKSDTVDGREDNATQGQRPTEERNVLWRIRLDQREIALVYKTVETSQVERNSDLPARPIVLFVAETEGVAEKA